MSQDDEINYRVDVLGDSVDDYISVASESLMSSDPKAWKTYLRRIGTDNVRGVFAGDQLVGGVAFYRMGQWFAGRELASAGVSGVAINPLHRGSGACALLMKKTLRELYDEGVPLSTLYASTQKLYRRCGYAAAGTQTKYSMPLSDFGTAGIELDRTLPVHRFATATSPPPIGALQYADEMRAKNSNGLLQRSEGLFDRLIHPYDGHGTITYLLGDVDQPDGYVILRPGLRERGVPQPLVSTDMVVNTPVALRRLAALLYDHRSMQGEFQWFGSPAESLLQFASRSVVDVKEQLKWLLRLLCVSKAIAGRGYPRTVTGELHLEIRDPLIPENAGRWVISIDDGVARISRGGDGVLMLGVDSLAAIYSSYVTPQQLIADGSLTSSAPATQIQPQLELMTAAFAGPSPWMPELF